MNDRKSKQLIELGKLMGLLGSIKENLLFVETQIRAAQVNKSLNAAPAMIRCSESLQSSLSLIINTWSSIEEARQAAYSYDTY